MPISLILSALLAAQPAPAATATTEPESQDIVVEGTRATKRQLRDFVKTVTATPLMGQVARFHAAACPVAIGLPSAQNAALGERMRRVAAGAGMRVGGPDCTPNIFVILAPDRKEMVDALQRRYPVYFRDVPAEQLRAIASSREPVVAWQVQSRLSADGELLERPADAGYYRVNTSSNPSRVRAASMPTFVASMLVIDVDAAKGLTVTQLADYAVMRTFASTDPERIVRTGVPTILSAIGAPEDRPIPVTLTHWDFGFLKGLYSSDNAYFAGYQRGDIEAKLRKELEQAAAEDGEN